MSEQYHNVPEQQVQVAEVAAVALMLQARCSWWVEEDEAEFNAAGKDKGLSWVDVLALFFDNIDILIHDVFGVVVITVGDGL